MFGLLYHQPCNTGCILSAERDDPTCAHQPSIDLSFARERTLGDKGGMMSRTLPAHPNLDHLKNQAKDLLPQPLVAKILHLILLHVPVVLVERRGEFV